jgi:CheY-like chemotaxis protein
MIIKDEDKVNDCIDLNGIRDKHHLRSYEYIIENKDILNLNEFEAFNLALICKGHRREDLLNNDIYKTIPCPDDPDKTIRIDLLAALLRIADELDMSHKRIAQSLKEFLNKFQSFDTITHLHWYKHYYSNGFLPCFIEQNTKPIKLSIPVSFDLPAGWDKNSFVIPFIINHLHNEIEYLNQVFIKHHFTMHIQEADIRINNSLQSIPKEIYNNIIDWALKKIKIRVLIVDDDPLIRKEFTYVIRDLGYEVEEAKDCKDALEKIKSSKFHLILLDLKMPDLNNRTSKDAGIDLLKLIKNNKRDNIIVIISAFEESQLIIDSLRNGADDFIIKDMLNEEFKNRVNQALKRNLHLIIDK